MIKILVDAFMANAHAVVALHPSAAAALGTPGSDQASRANRYKVDPIVTTTEPKK